MRSHISVHPRTTKYFSNSFVVKTKIEKEGLPKDSPAGLGAGGPRFESGRPDQKYLPYFLQLIKSVLHPQLHCGILADRRSRSANDSIVKTCHIRKNSTTRKTGVQIRKSLNRAKL
jgi:hypothetical protein